MTSSWIAGWLLLVAAFGDEAFQQNVRTTEPLSAAQQARRFHVPDGFEVQLVAAEPQIQKPMNLAFDARGRLWVSGSVEYPYPAESTGRDKIQILNDTDGDGRADQFHDFANDLNIPIGLYPYRDGVVAYSIASIQFFRDTDGDDRADQRQVLYGPLDRPVDTHGMQNAFRRGPDGWLYVNHGFANRTTFRGTDGSQLELHSGNTYRIRLDGSRVEPYTWGQVNPFGSAFTELGDLITADCHSKPLTLLIRGGQYESFGKPHDGLGFAPELMSHHHGSTGLAGVAYCDDETWPSEFQGSLFIGNVVTSRIHRDTLTYSGATAKAVEQTDFLTCDDPWFRPVDLRFGPDGALYIADFYNRIIGHYEVPLDHPGRDRQRGRIWRVVYRGRPGTTNAATKPARDLTRESVDELITALGDARLPIRELALDQLSDRIGDDAVTPLQEMLRAVDRDEQPWPRRSGARWALFRLGKLTAEELSESLDDPAPPARVHALRILAETPVWNETQRQQATQALRDEDPRVERAAAEALGQQTHPQHVATLLTRLVDLPPDELVLRHSLRIALRNQLRDEQLLAEVAARSWPSAELRELADVALALRSAESASLVLDYVAAHQLPASDLERFLPYAARYVSPSRVGQLAREARRQAGEALALQATLFRSIQQSLPTQRWAAEPELVAWGQELVTGLIASVQAQELKWQIDSGASIWGLEPRTAHDGFETSFLSSLPGGEAELGRLVSKPFEIPAKLSFEVCGHRGDPTTVAVPQGNLPGQELAGDIDDNFVQLRLVETGQIVRRAFPPRNDRAERVTWDLHEWVGQSAVLEVVDRMSGPAYAWLAVARFQPPVVAVPAQDPRSIESWQLMAAELIARLQLHHDRHVLQSWLREGYSWSSRSAAGQALAQLAGEPIWEVMSQLLTDDHVPRVIREGTSQAIANGQGEPLDALLIEVFRQLSLPQQARLARHLVSTPVGADRLVGLVEQGAASGQLLQNPAIRAQLDVAGDKGILLRIEHVIAALPQEDAAVATLLQTTRESFAAHPADLSAGQQLFTKNCRICHQVNGQGELVGPQLDGIGNRGLERLIEDVLTPHRNVDLAFRSSILSLTDGRVVAGLVRHRAEDAWTVVNLEGKEERIAVDQIEASRQSAVSVMPDNFASLLGEPDRRNCSPSS